MSSLRQAIRAWFFMATGFPAIIWWHEHGNPVVGWCVFAVVMLMTFGALLQPIAEDIAKARKALAAARGGRGE